MSLAEDIDTFALTKERAVVAKALAVRRPGVSPRDYLADAAAVLLALDKHYNSWEREAKAPASDDSALFGLSVDQEIRARAADSAARLFGPVCAAITTVVGEDAPDDMIQRFANAWGEATRGAATYIETGAATLPSPVDTATAGTP
jgi:hypothetical protein